MNSYEADTIRQTIRSAYGDVAKASDKGGRCGTVSSCCGVSDSPHINRLISTRLGYSSNDITTVPEGSDMGLGCGNPRAIASLQPGERVLDLGSGGGFDVFLAAQEVGEQGFVIGIDMTPNMISKARGNAKKGHFDNVDFRLGEIEHLPVADNSVDVIISNCVVNLSTDKLQVFRDAYRVLKHGGRLAISDVVASAPIPAALRDDPYLHTACVTGASSVAELEHLLVVAGFRDVCIQPKDHSREFIKDWAPGRGVEDYILSASIEAVKAA